MDLSLGGVIPKQDYEFIRGAGVSDVFSPGVIVFEAGFAGLAVFFGATICPDGGV